MKELELSGNGPDNTLGNFDLGARRSDDRAPEADLRGARREGARQAGGRRHRHQRVHRRQHPSMSARRPVDLLIAGATLVATVDDERREIAGGWVAIRDGLIAAVGAPGAEPPARVPLDASGCLVDARPRQHPSPPLAEPDAGLPPDDDDRLPRLAGRALPAVGAARRRGHPALDAGRALASSRSGAARRPAITSICSRRISRAWSRPRSWRRARSGCGSTPRAASSTAGAATAARCPTTCSRPWTPSSPTASGSWPATTSAGPARWCRSRSGRTLYSARPTRSCARRPRSPSVSTFGCTPTSRATRADEAYCLDLHGCRPVEWFESLGWSSRRTWVAHCFFPSDAEIARLGAAGVGVAHCATSGLIMGVGIAPVVELRKAGVPVGIGVDGPRTPTRPRCGSSRAWSMIANRFRSRPGGLRRARRPRAGHARRRGLPGTRGRARRPRAGRQRRRRDLAARGAGVRGAVSDPIDAWLRCGPSAPRHVLVGGGRSCVTDGSPPSTTAPRRPSAPARGGGAKAAGMLIDRIAGARVDGCASPRDLTLAGGRVIEVAARRPARRGRAGRGDPARRGAPSSRPSSTRTSTSTRRSCSPTPRRTALGPPPTWARPSPRSRSCAGASAPAGSAGMRSARSRAWSGRASPPRARTSSSNPTVGLSLVHLHRALAAEAADRIALELVAFPQRGLEARDGRAHGGGDARGDDGRRRLSLRGRRPGAPSRPGVRAGGASRRAGRSPPRLQRRRRALVARAGRRAHTRARHARPGDHRPRHDAGRHAARPPGPRARRPGGGGIALVVLPATDLYLAGHGEPGTRSLAPWERALDAGFASRSPTTTSRTRSRRSGTATCSRRPGSPAWYAGAPRPRAGAPCSTRSPVRRRRSWGCRRTDRSRARGHLALLDTDQPGDAALRAPDRAGDPAGGRARRSARGARDWIGPSASAKGFSSIVIPVVRGAVGDRPDRQDRSADRGPGKLVRAAMIGRSWPSPARRC